MKECENCELLLKIRNEITDLQTYLCYTGDEKKIELDQVLEIIDYYIGENDG